MKAIRVNSPGGPETLSFEDIQEPIPGPNEVLVRMEAIGVNFIDVYHRSGRYPLDLPFSLGMEGAGVIEGVGSEVDEFDVGDRVVNATEVGTYSQLQAIRSDRIVRIPDSVDTRTAAALMLQGMTAHYLTVSTFPLRAGHTALIHAGAGGAGRLIIQMAKNAGAKAIATVGTPEKVALHGKRAQTKSSITQRLISSMRFGNLRVGLASMSCMTEWDKRLSTVGSIA